MKNILSNGQIRVIFKVGSYSSDKVLLFMQVINKNGKRGQFPLSIFC